MLPRELNLDGIVNNDYKDVVFGRRSVRMFDPDYKIAHEEIEQIIQEAICSTPSAVDTQPWHFLIIDTDEGKAKMNDIMRAFDKDRTNKCSFTIIPFSDAQWFEHFDEQIRREKEATPEMWTPEMESVLVPLTYSWIDELCEDDASYLHKSVDFQAGLVTMSFMYAARAHGYDTAFMDSWDPQLIEESFGIDLERFRPQGAIAVGKKVNDAGYSVEGTVISSASEDESNSSTSPERYRYPASELITWA